MMATPQNPAPPDDSFAATRAVDAQHSPQQSPALTGAALTLPPLLESNKPETKSSMGDALFSTDLGRRSSRDPPKPLPPVIARGSGKMTALAQEAKYWYERYRYQYLCYFPGCGYTIHDLFDNDYIHRNDPAFVKDLISFMMWGNVNYARTFSIQWSKNNRNRLEIIRGDLSSIYDPHDPLAIVDKIFVNNETREFPRPFLWHALNMMRMSMYNVSEKLQMTPSMLEAASSNASKSEPKAINASNLKPNMVAAEEQLQPVVSSGGPHVPEHGQNMFMQPVSGNNTIDMYPVHQAQNTRMGHPPHYSGSIPGGGPAPVSPMMSDNFTYQRTTRDGSGSFHYQAHADGWTENHARPTMGQQSRQPSGHMSLMPSPRFRPRLPSGQYVMDGPNSAVPFGPSVGMPPPSAASTQFMLPPMMYQGNVPYGAPQAPVGPQMYHIGPTRERQGPIADFTNTPHYNCNPPLHHGNAQRNSSRRMTSAEKRPGLYNPYGSERPDFANIPSNQGRNNRNGSANFSGRMRGFSNVSNHRYEQHNPSFGEPVHSSQFGREPDVGYSVNQSKYRYNENDPTIVGDKVRGCGEDWIGPKNDTVRRLIVFDLPSDMTIDNIKDIFEQEIGIKGLKPSIRADRHQRRYVEVVFDCASDAAKGLGLNRHTVRGHTITVKVHKFHYTRRIFSNSRSTQDESDGTQGRHRNSSMSHDTYMTADMTGIGTASYSPQDARSDLVRSHVRAHLAATGSPGKRSSSQNETPSHDINANKQEARKISVCAVDQQIEKVPSTKASQIPSEEAISNAETGCVPLEAPREVKGSIHSSLTQSPPYDKKVRGGKTVHSNNVRKKNRSASTEDTSLDSGAGIAKASSIHKVDSPTDITPLRTESSEQALLRSPTVDRTAKVSLTEEAEVVESVEQSAIVQEASPARNMAMDLATDVASVNRDETPSDDELKNDTSFHSAQEEQQEIAKPNRSGNTPTQVDNVKPSYASAIMETNRRNERELLAVRSTPVLEEGAGPFIHENVTSNKTTGEEHAQISTPPSKAPVTSEKKPGATNTTSLHPFAQAKALQRKEKEAKKKQKKKKARAEKTMSDKNVIHSTNHTKSEGHLSSDPCSPPHEAAQDAPSELVTSRALGIKETKAPHTNGHVARIEPGDLDSAHDVSKNAQLFAHSHFPLMEETVLKRPNELTIHDKPPSKTISSATTSSSPSSKKSSAATSPKAHRSIDKGKTPIRVAVPVLDFLKNPRTSSSKASSPASEIPSLTGTSVTDGRGKVLPSMQYDGTPLASPRSQTKQNSTSIGASEPTQDKTNVALTLKDQPPLSPSPTGERFHTPLQTPLATAPSLTNAPKSRKSKKKKKKSHILNDQQDKIPKANGEPFSEQFKEVDSFIAHPQADSGGQPQSYFAVRDARIAINADNTFETLQGSSQHVPQDGDGKDSKVRLLQQLHDYLHEKQTTYAAITEDAFQGDPEPEKKFGNEDIRRMNPPQMASDGKLWRFQNALDAEQNELVEAVDRKPFFRSDVISNGANGPSDHTE